MLGIVNTSKQSSSTQYTPSAEHRFPGDGLGKSAMLPNAGVSPPTYIKDCERSSAFKIPWCFFRR